MQIQFTPTIQPMPMKLKGDDDAEDDEDEEWDDEEWEDDESDYEDE